MFRSRVILISNGAITLKFNWHLDKTATDMPVKFQSDAFSSTINPETSRDLTIWRLIGCQNGAPVTTMPLYYNETVIVSLQSTTHRRFP